MKIIFTLIVILVTGASVFSQTSNNADREIKELQLGIKKLRTENTQYKNRVNVMRIHLADLSQRLDSLRMKTAANSIIISQTASNLGLRIKETEVKSEGKIAKVSDSLDKNSLYAIIGVLTAISLAGLFYWLLNRRQNADKTDFGDQLSRTKSSIEESFVKQLEKQTELMDSQLQSIQHQKSNLQSAALAEPDHSLALKLASEINLIERNIKLMDAKTKGLKQLEASVAKLKDNLSANGYEMPQLLGKQFHEGMKVIVTSSVPDDKLEKGAEIISKILIPQVNYNDKMIQTAQLEVSVGF